MFAGVARWISVSYYSSSPSSCAREFNVSCILIGLVLGWAFAVTVMLLGVLACCIKSTVRTCRREWESARLLAAVARHDQEEMEDSEEMSEQ